MDDNMSTFMFFLLNFRKSEEDEIDILHINTNIQYIITIS
jgi:hypothetical protein